MQITNAAFVMVHLSLQAGNEMIDLTCIACECCGRYLVDVDDPCGICAECKRRIVDNDHDAFVELFVEIVSNPSLDKRLG